MAAPAHATPVSAHAMVHTCCTPTAMKERIFSEAKELGAEYIRVDVELNAIFEGPNSAKAVRPNWSGLDEVIELSRKYHQPVLGILLGTPRFASACPERPDASKCAAADASVYGALAGAVAGHAADTIHHWEIVNEPDGRWAFGGTPEQYAGMLSAAHDGIKARAPDASIVLGGLMRPHKPEWLERVFATPGADAIHKFDIANIHLRGSVDAVVRRYVEFRSWLARRGFRGPLWVTELGYPADPAFQTDPEYAGGDPSQAAYLTQVLVGLGEVGAQQVFVTLRDEGVGKYSTEGLEHIDEAAGYAVSRRESFAAVHRVVDEWNQLMAWRDEQRDNEREQRAERSKAALWASAAQAARRQLRAAHLRVQAEQDELARSERSARVTARLSRRLARARALLAGRQILVLLRTAVAGWHSQRAGDHAAAVALLKREIAGG